MANTTDEYQYTGPFPSLNTNPNVSVSDYIKSDTSTESKSSSRESTLGVNGKTGVDITNWGYKDFINERADWVKGTKSLTDGPAWFYFKIFFKFNTAFGLLGGILDNNPNNTTDTAIKYLNRLSATDRYPGMYLGERSIMLKKFVKTLSYISSNAPWFFSKVNDANSGLTMDFNNLTKEKSITIECLEESIDMKLTTMMDLYKFCAFDDVNQREILPENLRKFDMDIMVFQAPLRYLHTSMMTLTQDVAKYKSNASSTRLHTDIMSYKLFTFKNCEFDYNSLNSMLPQSFTNDSPFKSIPQIKINYERVYQHSYNEFANIMFGSSGKITMSTSDASQDYTNNRSSSGSNSWFSSIKNFFKKDDELNVQTNDVVITASDVNKRGRMLQYLHNHPNYYNPNSTVYKALVDASEENLSAAMRMVDNNTAFGNLYWSGSIGDTLKNTGKNVLNNYKEMGQSLAGRWGIKL